MIRLFLIALTLSLSLQASATWLQKRILIPTQQYHWLTTAQKKAYLSQVREGFQKLEEARLKATPVASFSLWLSSAFAEGERCLIGGVDQPVIGGKCSSRGNECEGQPDSFQCGPVFGGVCISRTPVGYISSRCRTEAAKSAAIDESKFETYSQDAEALFAKHCSNDKTDSVPCSQFKRQMESTRSKFTKLSDANAEKSQPKTIPTEKADAAKPAAASPAKTPTPASPAPTAASAPSAPAATTSALPGPCLDVNPGGGGCVEGSITVGKNENYQTCKDKKLPDVLCGEFEILNCHSNHYEKGIRAKDMAAFVKPHQRQADEAFKKYGIAFPEAELEKMSRSEDSFYPQGNADFRANMDGFAELYNRDKNLCPMIASFKDRRGENSRCNLQNQRFPPQNISLKDLADMGQKNFEEMGKYLQSCEQKKEFTAGALMMEQACDGEKCQGAILSGFPLNFQANANGGGVLEFIDANGDKHALQIFGGPNGVLKTRSPKGEMIQLKSLQKVAACRVMLTSPVSNENKNQSECDALMQFRAKVMVADGANKSKTVSAPKTEIPAGNKSAESAK